MSFTSGFADVIRRYGGPSRKVAAVLSVAVVLAGCQADELGYGPKHLRPVSSEVKERMQRLEMAASSPIMLRIFKEESTLEVWKQTRSGRYALLDTFEICKWSGGLGPKKKEGDRQAPEGFYEITPALMNPNSNYHLAFNLGYPNKYDRAYGRTGSHLMVHGACSSRGCYAMTDAQVQDIYALARDSFKGGQRSFQVQAFPFRMTAENMARHRTSEHYDFWKMLKRGYDHFEVTKLPPKIDVCEKRYVFDAVPLVEGVPFRATAQCPAFEIPTSVARAVEKKEREDEAEIIRIAASEERAKRREQAIASFFGAEDGKGEAAKDGVSADSVAIATTTAATGDALKAADGTPVAAASGPMTPVPAGSPARAQAFAATESSAPGSFFSRFFSSGKDEAATIPAEGVADAGAPRPAPKP